jgi:hypothetical protein
MPSMYRSGFIKDVNRSSKGVKMCIAYLTVAMGRVEFNSNSALQTKLHIGFGAIWGKQIVGCNWTG